MPGAIINMPKLTATNTDLLLAKQIPLINKRCEHYSANTHAAFVFINLFYVFSFHFRRTAVWSIAVTIVSKH